MRARAPCFDIKDATAMTTSDRREAGPSATAYRHLRDALVNHEFQPGERLLINTLASKYRVSTTPVREALSRLREERLIDFRPGQGYYCKMPEADELKDLFELLCILLVFSVERIVSRESCLAMLGERVGSLEEQAPTDTALDPPGARRFAALVEAAIDQVMIIAGNDAVLQTGRNALIRTHFVRRIDFESPDSVRQASTTLVALADALRRSDRQAADQIVRRETARSIDRLPRLLRDGLWRFYCPYGR